MSSEFLDKVREIAKQFFAISLEEKQKYSVESAIDFQGYQNKSVSQEEELLRNEMLYLTIYPEDQRKLKLWPEKPEVFRYKTIFYNYSFY